MSGPAAEVHEEAAELKAEQVPRCCLLHCSCGWFAQSVAVTIHQSLSWLLSLSSPGFNLQFKVDLLALLKPLEVLSELAEGLSVLT